MAAWTRLPAAAPKDLKFKTNGKFSNWLRYICWNYFWEGREYGLQFHDQCFEPAPEVREALRRLNLKEPWLFDARHQRMIRAHVMAAHLERLPKEKWTQWDEETFYLKPYLDEIEAEKCERKNTSGLKPSYELLDLPVGKWFRKKSTGGDH